MKIITVHNVIQGLWIGSELSVVEVLCIRSFLHHGHQFHLYTYGPVRNVPEGTIIKNAHEIVPEGMVFRRQGSKGSLQSFSDLFRWFLLRKVGGLYVDMDVICLKPFDFSDEIIFGYESDITINVAVVGFPKGHFVTTAMAKACEDVNLFQPIDTERTIAKKLIRKIFIGRDGSREWANFGEPGGPWYFTKFARHFDIMHLAKPTKWFYPIPWEKWQDALMPNSGAEEAVKDSYAVHLWNSFIGYDPDVNKGDLNFKGTLIGELKERYL